MCSAITIDCNGKFQTATPPGLQFQAGLRPWFDSIVLPDRFVSVCDSIPAVQAGIQSGLGIGPLPCTIADQDNSMVRCFDPADDMGDTGWMIASPAAFKRPEVQKLAAFAAPRFRAHFKSIAGPNAKTS